MTDYTNEFYDAQEHIARRSAQTVVPIIYELFTPERVLDVGCGRGWWGQEFAAYGDCAVIGIDGDYVPEPVIPFVAHDLRTPLPPEFHASADVTVCMEVAEHLDDGHADRFINDLCATSPVVVFSAAVPGQGGHGHVNEQWPSYWAARFHHNNYRVSAGLRWRLWNDPQVGWWYAQNILVAVAAEVDVPELFAGPADYPYPVLHPRSVDWHE